MAKGQAPEADRSDERGARGGRYDGLVTEAECARTPIPDGPLPRLCGEPAYELAVQSGFLCLLSLPRQRKEVPPRTGATPIDH